ncbi:MAG: glycosyltransferase [Candidatus Eisenbacteria bacterium]|uniref:Glycosyltransferase n=1 Tax=Eiseniibacteriota bacterium TaxID=2212470 RepID=A0A937XAQ9_UNCEI|nr:glycosyltransferase [Candidatus Eisenbacteria bacterium]
MIPIQNILAACAAPAVLAGTAMAGTFWALAVAALPRRPRPSALAGEARSSFAIVIPAHDEEQGIGRTLDSCRALDYPAGSFAVHVVADNCADRTAEVARDRGVECFERRDPARAGKGHALGYAFERIDLARHDAILVLDADCEIDGHALRAADRLLGAGDLALQLNNVASNPDESATSYALALGNHMENEFFYAPKSRWGGLVLLRGTGMVLHRDLLRRLPWRAHSIVEDAQYSLELARRGIRVRFVAEAAVRSPFPAGQAQLRVQRTRWAGGNLKLARRQGPAWIVAGLRHRRPAWIEVGWTLVLLSRPLVALVALLAFALALAAALAEPARRPPLPLAAAAGPLALLAAYVGLGALHFGLTRRRLGLLLVCPATLLRLLAIALAGLFRRDEGDWARTPRGGGGGSGAGG